MATQEIIKQRAVLEDYIRRHPQFATSYSPLALLPDAPPIAKRMAQAAYKTGLGPMAAVAGTYAQIAAEAAFKANATEAIVENGGDIYLNSNQEVIIALYARSHPTFGKLAFRVTPDYMPTAICSSSGKLGHSKSFGKADLATVISKDASLADAAATLAGNLVKKHSDIWPTLEKVMSIPGILGALIIKEDKIGLIGNLPRLIKHTDQTLKEKVSKDLRSNFYSG